jgi:hypothetical protein
VMVDSLLIEDRVRHRTGRPTGGRRSHRPRHGTRETLAKPVAWGVAAGMGFDAADTACSPSDTRSERS